MKKPRVRREDKCRTEGTTLPTASEVVDGLTKYNSWRLGIPGFEQPDPKALTKLIDNARALLTRASKAGFVK